MAILKKISGLARTLTHDLNELAKKETSLKN
jgi:hypothetical protein